eukprot:5887964-Prorocentrum_lima.AAC.1
MVVEEDATAVFNPAVDSINETRMQLKRRRQTLPLEPGDGAPPASAALKTGQQRNALAGPAPVVVASSSSNR